MRAIWILSDKPYQEKFWIRGERPLMQIGDWVSGVLDFQTTLLTFFQNWIKAKESLEIEEIRLKLEKPPIRILKIRQLDLLNQLHNKLFEFKYLKKIDGFVFDTKWNSVISSAKSLYKELSRKPEFEEVYPKFICDLYERSNNSRKKITDFLGLINSIWELSNKDYQERFWVAKQEPYTLSNFELTMEGFEEEAEVVLDTSDYAVEMTPNQREMLQKFYDMMEDFEENGEAEDPGYGVNDAAIIEDPLFSKCREYAKLVYEELSRDDLDKWEAQRNKE
jgi:hypothetical protein